MPEHAVFAKMSAILASNFMQNMKKIVRAVFQKKTHPPIEKSVLEVLFLQKWP